MELYERILEEASTEERTPSYSGITASRERSWSLPAPGVGGYVTVQDLEWEHKRQERERMKVLQEQNRRASEVRVLRGFARQGVHSTAQGMAFKSLQRKYPAEWDRIRWG